MTPEEKKQLLRERRAAKMAKGNATSRLNTILGQGSSVHDKDVTSILDRPAATETGEISVPSADDDPEIQDIISVEPKEADIEEIFSKMLGQTGGQAPGGGEDEFSKMMMSMMGGDGGAAGAGEAGGNPFGAGSPFGAGGPFGAGAGGNPLESLFAGSDNPLPTDATSQYQQDLANYNLYQQKVWKSRFLVVRLVTVLANFFYHFCTSSDFIASSHSYIRGIVPVNPVTSFITIFATIEILLLSSFYVISTQNKLFQTASDNSLLIKGINFGSMFLPQLNKFRPVVVRLLGYYELLGMILGDMALVVVLFGLLSSRR